RLAILDLECRHKTRPASSDDPPADRDARSLDTVVHRNGDDQCHDNGHAQYHSNSDPGWPVHSLKRRAQAIVDLQSERMKRIETVRYHSQKTDRPPLQSFLVALARKRKNDQGRAECCDEQ